MTPGAEEVSGACACGASLDADEAICAACAGGEFEKKRKKLLKSVRQVDELKLRRDEGDQLEKTQLDKIVREPEIRSQLAELDASDPADLARAAAAQGTKRKQRGPGNGEPRRGIAIGLGASAPNGLQTGFEIRSAKKQRKQENKLERKEAAKLAAEAGDW